MLLVLSLDSASEPLVEEMCAAGRLPAIDAIRRSGCSRILESELEGSVYTTLQTGLRLADHGVYFPLQWSAEAQTSHPSGPRQIAHLRRSSILHRAAAEGRRVLVLDMPETEPHTVPGSVIASGVEFEARILLPRWSRPRSILNGLDTGPRVNEVFGVPDAGYLLRTARELIAAPVRLPAAWRRIAADGEFDLVWMTFAAAHQAGHILFDDTAWPATMPSDARARLRGSLERVYEQVDHAIGQILDHLPQGARVLLLSAKGMGPNAARTDLLRPMIDRVLGQEGRKRSSGASPLWTLRSSLPMSLRARCADLLPANAVSSLMGRLETMGRDWRHTRAFALPCDVSGFIRLNVLGRERRGCVTESDVRGLIQEIREGLLSFSDIGGDTDGAPTIAAVREASEVVGAGAALNALPDLLVDWTPGRANLTTGVRSKRFGVIERHGVGTGRSGNHCPGNVITLMNGSTRFQDGTPARLEDVAPTIASFLGMKDRAFGGSPIFT